MKRLLVPALFLLTLFISCSKEKNKNPVSFDLKGRWDYYQYYQSAGGLPDFYPAPVPGQWIDFKDNGSFSSNMDLFEPYSTYEIQDSVKVKLSPTVNGLSLFGYWINKENGNLTVYSIDRMCIEGCGMVFKR